MINKIHLYDKIISPVITEKSTNLSEQNKIVFKINRNANKKNVKKSIEKIFKVNVIKVNIINKKTRTKRIPTLKSISIITLKVARNLPIAFRIGERSE